MLNMLFNKSGNEEVRVVIAGQNANLHRHLCTLARRFKIFRQRLLFFVELVLVTLKTINWNHIPILQQNSKGQDNCLEITTCLIDKNGCLRPVIFLHERSSVILLQSRLLYSQVSLEGFLSPWTRRRVANRCKRRQRLQNQGQHLNYIHLNYILWFLLILHLISLLSFFCFFFQHVRFYPVDFRLMIWYFQQFTKTLNLNYNDNLTKGSVNLVFIFSWVEILLRTINVLFFFFIFVCLCFHQDFATTLLCICLSRTDGCNVETWIMSCHFWETIAFKVCEF